MEPSTNQTHNLKEQCLSLVVALAGCVPLCQLSPSLSPVSSLRSEEHRLASPGAPGSASLP